MKPIFLILIIFLFLHALYLNGQSPVGISIQKDIVYSRIDSMDLKLDIGQPEGKGPFPVILFFHGGGWQQGDKWHMHKWIQKFAVLGYIGVSVEGPFKSDAYRY